MEYFESVLSWMFALLVSFTSPYLTDDINYILSLPSRIHDEVEEQTRPYIECNWRYLSSVPVRIFAQLRRLASYIAETLAASTDAGSSRIKLDELNEDVLILIMENLYHGFHGRKCYEHKTKGLNSVSRVSRRLRICATRYLFRNVEVFEKSWKPAHRMLNVLISSSAFYLNIKYVRSHCNLCYPTEPGPTLELYLETNLYNIGN